jgi:hypothetical protein
LSFRASFFLTALLVSVVLIGCGKQDSTGEPTSPGEAATPSPAESPNSSPTDAIPSPSIEAPPAQPEPQRSPVRFPPFLEGRNIKDIPIFPRSSVNNFIYGPVAGSDTAIVTFEVFDTFDNVTKFYDNAIKKHGWRVDSRICDIGDCSWRLSKGTRDLASIQVKVGPENRVACAINRTQAPVAQ